MMLGIFHYAFIMRQLLLNPDMSTAKLCVHFAIFVANCCVMGYIVLFKISRIAYPTSAETKKKSE